MFVIIIASKEISKWSVEWGVTRIAGNGGRLTRCVTSGQDARILLSSASDVTGMMVVMSEPERGTERDVA